MAFNKNEYDIKFHRENYTTIKLQYRNGKDDGIINKLKSVENRTDYIRQLILKDLEKANN